MFLIVYACFLLWLTAHLWPLETNFKYMFCHYVPIVACVYFIWYHYIISTHIHFELGSQYGEVFVKLYCLYAHQFNALTWNVLYCLLLHLIHCSCPLAPTDLSAVTNLAALCVHLSMWWALSGRVWAFAVSACLFWWHARLHWPSYVVFAGILSYSNFVKLFCLCYGSHNCCLGSLCLYPLHPWQNIFTGYGIISPYCGKLLYYFISLSLIPWMNCSFNCLSSSW